MEKEYILNLADLREKATELSVKKGVFLLYGDLGAGKTSFSQFFCQSLGINEPITSPTFLIRKTYLKDNVNIAHYDLYRINQLQSLVEIGFNEDLNNATHILIEWPDNIPQLKELVKKYNRPIYEIHFSHIDDPLKRKIITNI